MTAAAEASTSLRDAQGNCDGSQDGAVGDCQAESGRGKLPVPPGQESEKHGCIRGLRAKARCPAQGHRARDSVPGDTMLGFPCVWAALRVGMGGAPPKAQPFADPPAHGPRPPALHAFKCPHQLSVFTETHLQENFMSPL